MGGDTAERVSLIVGGEFEPLVAAGMDRAHPAFGGRILFVRARGVWVGLDRGSHRTFQQFRLLSHHHGRPAGCGGHYSAAGLGLGGCCPLYTANGSGFVGMVDDIRVSAGVGGARYADYRAIASFLLRQFGVQSRRCVAGIANCRIYRCTRNCFFDQFVRLHHCRCFVSSISRALVRAGVLVARGIDHQRADVWRKTIGWYSFGCRFHACGKSGGGRHRCHRRLCRTAGSRR